MAKKNYKYQERIKVDWKAVARPNLSEENNDNAKVRLSLEHYEPGSDLCLSNCDSDDVRHALDCFRRMTTMTWMQVLQTSTKDSSDKTGLHWTPYKDSALKRERPKNIGNDHAIAGVRAGGKYRIFGFRYERYFYVIWFDPEHTVTDG